MGSKPLRSGLFRILLVLVATGAGGLLQVAGASPDGPSPVVAEQVQPPLGLPPLPAPYATHSAEKVALGRRLFFDRRLSFNTTLSCAMCHLEGDAYASTQSKQAIGMEGRTLRRNAPTLLNVAYQKSLFHDGRETRLDLQIWGPLLDEDEMANPSLGYVLDHVARLDDYETTFARLYPAEGLSVHTLGDAFAAFEASLLSGNSRFDRWYFGKDKAALSTAEQSGFAVFTGKGQCSACHVIESDFALFTDDQFHDTGIGYRASMQTDRDYVIPLAPGVETRMSLREIQRFGEQPRNDVGRFEVTLKESDRWAYKTPSLRDVSRTRPYMHDGSIATLEEVVDYYDKGAVPHQGLSGILQPLHLSASEKADLVAFLRALDGQSVGDGEGASR